MTTISREDILKAISEMSVMDIVTLVKEMEDKFGVSAAAPVAVAAAPAQADEAVAEEKKTLTVVMTSFGTNKVAVIKVVRELTGLGLKEAKDLVEAVPATIKENQLKEDADSIKKKLEEAGATVELK